MEQSASAMVEFTGEQFFSSTLTNVSTEVNTNRCKEARECLQKGHVRQQATAHQLEAMRWGMCNACGMTLVPGSNWHHKPHSWDDLCHEDWQQLAEVQRAEYVIIDVPSAFGSDGHIYGGGQHTQGWICDLCSTESSSKLETFEHCNSCELDFCRACLAEEDYGSDSSCSSSGVVADK